MDKKMGEEITSEQIELNPQQEFVNLMRENVEQAHSYLHRLWNKELSGEDTGWNLEDIYRYHKMVLGDMRSSGVKHVSNIDTLDTTETLSKIKELKSDKTSMLDLIVKALEVNIKDPIAFLVDSSEDIKVLINLPKKEENSFVAIIIMSRIKKFFGESIVFVFSDEKTSFSSRIPILGLSEDLKNDLFNKIVFEDVEKLSKKKIVSLPPDRVNKKIYELTLAKNSRKQIAEEINLSKNTVYLRQKKMGLL